MTVRFDVDIDPDLNDIQVKDRITARLRNHITHRRYEGRPPGSNFVTDQLAGYFFDENHVPVEVTFGYVIDGWVIGATYPFIDGRPDTDRSRCCHSLYELCSLLYPSTYPPITEESTS